MRPTIVSLDLPVKEEIRTKKKDKSVQTTDYIKEVYYYKKPKGEKLIINRKVSFIYKKKEKESRRVNLKKNF